MRASAQGANVSGTALIRSGPLWFPGSAAQLAEKTWQTLARHGIGRGSYATARILRPEAARNPWLALAAIIDSGRPEPLLIEAPTEAVQGAFGPVGVELCAPPALPSATLKSGIDAAFARLRTVYDLAQTLSALIWSLHPIAAPDPQVDVGFSDPSVPFSIFVSLPPLEATHADLRLAESILHEAMHLQLTLLEDVTPLVLEDALECFSPWMDRPRPAQGVLHGLYVFGVVRQFLRGLRCRDEAEARYVAHRLQTIGAEMRLALSGIEGSKALTAAGLSLLRLLREEAMCDNPALLGTS